jgi:hypothetical protein
MTDSPAIVAPAPKGLKALVGRKMSTTIKFLGEDVSINKLSVAEVMDIQAKAQAIEEAAKAPDAANKDAEDGIAMLRLVIRAAVEGGGELTDADFLGFPMDELSKVVEEVMKFSGIGPSQAGNSPAAAPSAA